MLRCGSTKYVAICFVTLALCGCPLKGFSIGGTISGLSGTVVLQNKGGDNLSITKNGKFVFATPTTAGAYDVTVLTQPAGQTCTVTNGSGIASADVTNVAVTCTNNTYTIGGTISGLSGIAALQLNGTNDLTANTSGSFVFAAALANGTTYAVSVSAQPVGQTCTVDNASGTVSGAIVTNVAVMCAQTPSIVSGTAAAGLPLVGTVTVKDALGATKSVPIGTNGSYDVDVTGMQPPLVIRAEGTVGSTTYVMHSATTTISANQTVNITPLTELIIDNVAGQIADNYFKNGDFSKLTATELEAESAALKAKLLAVLVAMKVDASIDLLRTPFRPLASALDAALDVIRVSVDPATNVATITNLVNQISIADDIATPAAGEPNPPPLSDTGMGTTADDIVQIRKVVTDFFDLYRSGLPLPKDILPLLSDGFLNQDQGRVDFANEIATNSSLVGGGVTDIEISALDYNYNNGTNPLAIVRFDIFDKNGFPSSPVNGFTVIRNNGQWRLNGNQSSLDITSQVMMVNNQLNGCRASGIEFDISDRDSSNSSTIAHVFVIGPGLPSGQGLPAGIGLIRYDRNTQGGRWQLANTGNPGWFPMTGGCNHSWGDAGISDAVIAAIPDNARYFLKAFDSGFVEVPLGPYGSEAGQGNPNRSGILLTLPKRPLTLVELNAATSFPAFTTSPTLSTYNGGALTISASGINASRQAWAYLGLTDGNGLLNSVSDDVTSLADGTFSRTFTLPNPAIVTVREVRVATSDAYDRNFMSTVYLRTP